MHFSIFTLKNNGFTRELLKQTCVLHFPAIFTIFANKNENSFNFLILKIRRGWVSIIEKF